MSELKPAQKLALISNWGEDTQVEDAKKRKIETRKRQEALRERMSSPPTINTKAHKKGDKVVSEAMVKMGLKKVKLTAGAEKLAKKYPDVDIYDIKPGEDQKVNQKEFEAYLKKNNIS